MTVDASPRARGDVVSARAGNRLLLFEPASRRLHALNTSAALVWEHLDGTATAHDIAARLGERYASDRAVVESDVALVIERFAGLGLLAVPAVGAPAAPAAGSPGSPGSPGSLLATVDAAAAARRRLDDRPWAWISGEHEAPGVRFRIRTEDPVAGSVLARALRALRCTEPHPAGPGRADPTAAQVYSVLHDGARWSVHAGGVPLGVVDSVDAVVVLVLGHLDRTVVAELPRALCFHGGAVRIGRHVVLLPGPGGSGTSTVTGALVRRGAGYIADQVVAFEPARGGVLAYPRPLGTMAPTDPTSIPGAVHSRGGPVGLVVSPVHSPGASTQLERRTGPDAVRLLLDTTYSFDELGADGFLALVALAHHVPVYQVRYDDLDVACEVVLELAHGAG